MAPPAALSLLQLAALGALAAASAAPSVRLQWKFVEWDFANETAQHEYMASGHYQHNVPVGVAADKKSGSLFVTVPRFVGGGAVPATVARVLEGRHGPNGQPLLGAFPSFADNDPAASGGIRSVLGMAADPFGRLWVLDNGRVEAEGGQPQLLVYEQLGASEEPRLVRRHLFPDSVASHSQSFLNDLALDLGRGFVYATDSSDPTGGQHGGLVVYDYHADKSWRALSSAASTVPAPGVHISINGVPLGPGPSGPQAGADGITLTPDGATVYFCPLTSRTVYAVESKVLRDQRLTQEQRAQLVRAAFSKSFSSDGISADSRGRVFTGSLDNSSVVRWAPSAEGFAAETVAADPATMTWPDSVSFDHRGGLLFLSNGPSHFALNFSEVNFRLWTVPSQGDSYMSSMSDGVGKRPAESHTSSAEVVILSLLGCVALLGLGMVLYWKYRTHQRRSSQADEFPSRPLYESVPESFEYERMDEYRY